MIRGDFLRVLISTTGYRTARRCHVDPLRSNLTLPGTISRPTSGGERAPTRVPPFVFDMSDQCPRIKHLELHRVPAGHDHEKPTDDIVVFLTGPPIASYDFYPSALPMASGRVFFRLATIRNDQRIPHNPDLGLSRRIEQFTNRVLSARKAISDIDV